MRDKVALAFTMWAIAAVLIAWQMWGRSPKAPVAVSLPSSPPSSLPPAMADAEFQRWLTQQAQRLDNAGVNPEAVRAEMQSRVQNLTTTQTRQLLQVARSPHAPAAEKILSTYLLVEAGPRALQELRELIASPVQASPTRSPGELDSVREKTLKIMAIDGLATHAQSDPAARATLAQAVAETSDPQLRLYAQKQLQRVQRQ